MTFAPVPVTVLDAVGALANGNADSTGAAATSLDQRVISLVTGTVFVTSPVILGALGIGAFKRGSGAGSERTHAQQPVHLVIQRVGAAPSTGTFALYGADLPDALTDRPVGNAYLDDPTPRLVVTRLASALNVNATTTIDASAVSTDAFDAGNTGYNWIVVVDGQIVPYSASALANIASWSISGGVVTLRAKTSGSGVHYPAGTEVVVYKTTPVQVLAPGLHMIENLSVRARTVYWTRWSSNQGAAERTLVTVNHLAS